MNFSQILSSLPSFQILFADLNADLGNTQIWGLLIFTCCMLTLHGVAVLSVAGTFHWIDEKMLVRSIFGANIVSYFIAILMIIAVHLFEIIAWAYACAVIQVFPENHETFYFAGEMYTTVGFGSFNLDPHWRILPIIISFSGIFAVSMSGAALYTMMGALLNHPNKSNKTKNS
ncbi:hypothetical protein SAMN06295945_0902 [Polynucleobacter meluiroseus]|uniref:Potassium channel domain-containing protein n=1 Tax=Polynucleobacter meluiroseus TaxID=1938814 RepID=A0A240E132_9BURK|nr:ion channel [Polynucleobacter meluiroseus]SNX28570.1 hypothetical protein SAMN06295945_0902 [Polynucleobacter meluiroseus]